MLYNNDVNVSTTTTALCSSRHVCNFVLHHAPTAIRPPLVFSAFFHDKQHKCKLCTSVVLCRVLALVIFEVKSNIVVVRRN